MRRQGIQHAIFQMEILHPTINHVTQPMTVVLAYAVSFPPLSVQLKVSVSDRMRTLIVAAVPIRHGSPSLVQVSAQMVWVSLLNFKKCKNWNSVMLILAVKLTKTPILSLCHANLALMGINFAATPLLYPAPAVIKSSISGKMENSTVLETPLFPK